MVKFRLLKTLRILKEYLYFPYWLIVSSFNYGLPDSYIYKRLRIRKLSNKFKLNLLVESGTFYGSTVSYALSFINRVISIEVYKPLFEKNLIYFKNYKSVEIIYGNSGDILNEITIDINSERILFWLDGHYSGSGTGYAKNKCPIFEELSAISSRKLINFVICIDDIRLFGKEEGYPTMIELLNFVAINKIASDIYFDRDCLILLNCSV